MTANNLIDGLSRISAIKKKIREDIDLTLSEIDFWKSWHRQDPNKLMQTEPQYNGCFGLGE